MANRPVALRQSDLAPIVKTMAKEGVKAWRVEVDPLTRKFAVIVDPQPETERPADDGWSDL